ncbi:MAG: TIGR02757 family protein [Deltaproteobacteria bacterium]|nr:MAG: TIGR02757 family protein [Deltaproteobacteria bacterium]
MEMHLSPIINRERLDELYSLYHRRELVHPDPLEFLYDYHNLRDREVVGLIASSLAYGRVAQILRSISSVLKRLNPSPCSFLLNSSKKSLLSTFADFKHRFTSGEELAFMLWAAKSAIEKYGSLYGCFTAGLNDDDDTVLPALSAFVGELSAYLSKDRKNSLLPSPNAGSACKRLNLFLRWMVRRDEVDPGGWSSVPISKLIVPLDTHMYRICLLLNLTRRKQADLRTAIDITRAFRRILPEDPVRYDFTLTRLGIRKDAGLEAALRNCEML